MMDKGLRRSVEIQKIAIKGLMADNVLGEELCLKGGNALALVYGVSDRFSQDIDFSMTEDFEDLESDRARIEKALKKEFSQEGYEVFDVRLKPRPKTTQDERWGGYSLTFKVIETEDALKFEKDPKEMERRAILIGQRGKVEIDISKYEYTDFSSYESLDKVEIKVLTLTAILYEKVRAICQQLPSYTKRGAKTPRARDFYDICQILDKVKPDYLSCENLQHFRAIFDRKEVGRESLLQLEEQREFHREDWPSVTSTTADEQLQSFDYYFDKVCELAKNIHARWNV